MIVQDLLCFSHLRWDFVFQRPQHLMIRCAAKARVFFVEEPVFTSDGTPVLKTRRVCENLIVLVPHIPSLAMDADAQQAELIEQFCREWQIRVPLFWFYNPMAITLVRNIRCRVSVYDCMDELSLFRGAPSQLQQCEARLLEFVDVVFAGGRSLFHAKSPRHLRTYLFPSGVDIPHFKRPSQHRDPTDQDHIPHPRIGFSGVLDERLDVALLRRIAELRPTWHFVMLGPTVKIDPSILPRSPNIHYLALKRYHELPAYYWNWDAAMLPFALNPATRFVSPTKIPEYLAAGLAVTSTRIADVISSYADANSVAFADKADDFVASLEGQLQRESSPPDPALWDLLSSLSWDSIWKSMEAIIAQHTPPEREGHA
jgi:UDP-galactopyranose mutase